jgi:hypothetical protein
MNKLAVAALVAAAIAAGILAPASAQTNVAYSNGAIKVVHYSIDPAYTYPDPGLGDSLAIETAGNLTLGYVNTGNVPATSVQFAVHAGNATEIIVDKGTFSPGASIEHEFALGPAFGDGSTIEVQQVTFADGTSWKHA